MSKSRKKFLATTYKPFSRSLYIFTILRDRALRTKEKRIHRHLYLAMLIQVVIRLILYVDQLVSRRGNGAIGDLKVRRTAEAAAAAVAATTVAAAGDADLVRGIDNTVRNLEHFRE